MLSSNELPTPRLLLRQWQPSDLEPFALMSSDADVMRYYPAPWSREQSDVFAQRVMRLIDERGWGFWAIEERASRQFIGFVGLHIPSHELPFSPCVEVGWRLAKPYWGLGYATEAAQSAISFGFQQLHLKELVAFTAITNLKSRAVMERLGMQFDSEFDHPQVPVESRLRRHVLYRLRSPG
ncbi:MAG: GNAT family N-acetyltransferase [Nitrospira sp.]|nr:GNAT family N-acetyltransferase [Nitrospira sp.]MCS6262641.1 GNAT family N-acetyltransferase [Nitrospira sp.]